LGEKKWVTVAALTKTEWRQASSLTGKKLKSSKQKNRGRSLRNITAESSSKRYCLGVTFLSIDY